MYVTLAGLINFKEEIKGSRFIAYVDRAESVEVAMGMLESIQKEHPNATHYCWAYHIADQYRFSDDGEPSGTAGRPILEVINHQGLDRVMAIVVRYFGGTKLGVGGLARAYSGTLAKAFNKASLIEVKPCVNLTLLIPFRAVDTVYRLLKDLNVHIAKTEYSEVGVQLNITTVLSEEETLIKNLTEATRGEVKIRS